MARKPAIFIAIENGTLADVRRAIENKRDALKLKHKHEGESYSPIQWAIKNQRHRLARSIHRSFPAKEYDPECYQDLLHAYLSARDWKSAKELLEDINLLSKTKTKSKLFSMPGSYKGRVQADFSKLNNFRLSCLKILIGSNQVDLIPLLKGRFDPSWCGSESEKELFRIALEGEEVEARTLEVLFSTFPEMDHKNLRIGADRNTLLHIACAQGDAEKTKVLIKHGARADFRNVRNSLPSESARYNGDVGFTKVIAIADCLHNRKPLNAVDLHGANVLTRDQFHFVWAKRGAIGVSLCDIDESISLKGVSLEEGLLDLSEVTVKQYTDMAFESFSEGYQEEEGKPSLQAVYPFNPGKKIKHLSNEEFLAFSSWLQILAEFYRRTSLGRRLSSILPGQFNNDLNKVLQLRYTLLVASREMLEKTLSSESKGDLKKLKRNEKKRLEETERILQQEIKTEKDFDMIYHHIVEQAKTALSLPQRHQLFQFYLLATTLMVQVGYPRQSLSLPENTREIGAYQQPIESFDQEDLIIIGTPLSEARIYVVDEIIERLAESDQFQNPLTYELLSEDDIKICMSHPRIAERINQLYDVRARDLRTMVGRHSMSVVQALKTLGQELWLSSTDAANAADEGAVFDEARAETALEEYLKFIQNLNENSSGFVDTLEEVSFYLPCRECNTKYSEIFSEMTYDGCSGQLGVTIKQWVSRYEEYVQDPNLSEFNPMLGFVERLREVTNPMEFFYSGDSKASLKGRFLATQCSQYVR